MNIYDRVVTFITNILEYNHVYIHISISHKKYRSPPILQPLSIDDHCMLSEPIIFNYTVWHEYNAT